MDIRRGLIVHVVVWTIGLLRILFIEMSMPHFNLLAGSEFYYIFAVSPIAFGIAHRPAADLRYWLTREFFCIFAIIVNTRLKNNLRHE